MKYIIPIQENKLKCKGSNTCQKKKKRMKHSVWYTLTLVFFFFLKYIHWKEFWGMYANCNGDYLWDGRMLLEGFIFSLVLQLAYFTMTMYYICKQKKHIHAHKKPFKSPFPFYQSQCAGRGKSMRARASSSSWLGFAYWLVLRQVT